MGKDIPGRESGLVSRHTKTEKYTLYVRKPFRLRDILMEGLFGEQSGEGR